MARQKKRTLRLGGSTVLFRLFVLMIGAASLIYLVNNDRLSHHTSQLIIHPGQSLIRNVTTEYRTTPAPKIPHQHVLYLKTHKTGSTTMFSILAEYCRTHDLLPLLPSAYHISQFSNRFTDKDLKTLPGVKKYDMVFSHLVYTPQILTYLHNDSFAVTSVREPFQNYISAFNFYKYEMKIKYLLNLPGPDPLMEYLKNPKKYETGRFASMTNNRMSVDLGYDGKKSFDDIQYIKQFINETARNFNLVIPMEYFDEGLILMKRALNWNTEDIIYIKKNEALSTSKKRVKPNASTEALQRELHAKSSKPDIMLYDHFLKVFKEKVAKENGLRGELNEFNEILKTIRIYCNSSKSNGKNLIIPAGIWNEGFMITPLKCHFLAVQLFTATNILLDDQKVYSIVESQKAQPNKKEPFPHPPRHGAVHRPPPRPHHPAQHPPQRGPHAPPIPQVPNRPQPHKPQAPNRPQPHKPQAPNRPQPPKLQAPNRPQPPKPQPPKPQPPKPQAPKQPQPPKPQAPKQPQPPKPQAPNQPSQ